MDIQAPGSYAVGAPTQDTHGTQPVVIAYSMTAKNLIPYARSLTARVFLLIVMSSCATLNSVIV